MSSPTPVARGVKKLRPMGAKPELRNRRAELEWTLNKAPCTVFEVVDALEHANKTAAAEPYRYFLALEAAWSIDRTWLARVVLEIHKKDDDIGWAHEWKKEARRIKQELQDKREAAFEKAEEEARLEEEAIQLELAPLVRELEARVRRKHADAKAKNCTAALVAKGAA